MTVEQVRRLVRSQTAVPSSVPEDLNIVDDQEDEIDNNEEFLVE